MRKLAVVATMCCLFGLTTQAQELRTGVRFGLGSSEFVAPNGSAIPNASSGIKFEGGLTANLDVLDFLSLQGDLLFAVQNGSFRGSDNPTVTSGSQEFSKNMHALFIELPLMPSLKLQLGNVAFKAFAGPSFMFNVGANYDKVYTNSNYQNYNETAVKAGANINSMTIGFTYGVGLDISISSRGVFFFDLRQANSQSLGTIQDADGQNIEVKTNNPIVFGIGTRYVL